MELLELEMEVSDRAAAAATPGSLFVIVLPLHIACCINGG